MAAYPNRFLALPAREVGGRITVPGDKSISHRALMLGAVAEGATTVHGFLASEDCLATQAAFEAMGVDIARADDGRVRIRGVGMHGLQRPAKTLDLGNSGTAIRLLMGLLAGQPFDSELTGDASLRQRPMERVAAPLRQMGARIESRPSRKRKWDYVFFLDLDGHAEDAPVRKALDEMKAKASLFKVLGAFPKAVL